MAFSATIRNQAYMGPGIRKLFGTWTGSAGDAAGTMTIAGVVQIAKFQKLDPLDSTNQILARCETSISSGISTLTIENQDNVTSGSFEITVLGQ